MLLWQVLYREPGSQKNYHSIDLQIGYKLRCPKQSLKQTVFKNHMRWIHDLYPLVNIVEIKGVDSCETIAHRLNSKIIEPNYQLFIKRFQPDLDSLFKNYHILDQKQLNFDCKNDHVWFVKCFVKTLKIYIIIMNECVF